MKTIRSIIILASLVLSFSTMAQAAPVVIEIFANGTGTWNQWISTGVTLNAGDTLTITATGQATTASGSRPLHDANGVSPASAPNATESLVNTANSGALVGMIDYPAGSIPTLPTFTTTGMYLLDDGVGSGLSGPGFVGTSFTQSVPQGVSGMLYLGFNDGFDGDNAGSYVVTITVTPATQLLTITKSGAGTGTVSSSPAGINCGATCSGSFTAGTLVTLTAAADSGSTFGGWSGACNGTSACQLTMDAAKSVTANFLVYAGNAAVPALSSAGLRV